MTSRPAGWRGSISLWLTAQTHGRDTICSRKRDVPDTKVKCHKEFCFESQHICNDLMTWPSVTSCRYCRCDDCVYSAGITGDVVMTVYILQVSPVTWWWTPTLTGWRRTFSGSCRLTMITTLTSYTLLHTMSTVTWVAGLYYDIQQEMTVDRRSATFAYAHTCTCIWLRKNRNSENYELPKTFQIVSYRIDARVWLAHTCEHFRYTALWFPRRALSIRTSQANL